MKCKTAILSLFLFLALLPNLAKSQSLTVEDVKTQMLADWARAKAYTTDYLNTMPANKYSFKAVDSIRSFAQQMLHLATGNLFLAFNATDATPPSWFSQDLEKRTSAQSKDSVVYYVNASYDYVVASINKLDMGKWAEKKTIFGMTATRFALLNKTFEHQTHHRGQTTIYIRLLGIKPPNERLF